MSLIIFAEFLGSTVLFLLEYAVEVADVVETAFIAYFGNRRRAVHKCSGGMPEPDIGNIV